MAEVEDEAAARKQLQRELRRRKILENSEARLKRITGDPSASISTGGQNSGSSDQQPPLNLDVLKAFQGTSRIDLANPDTSEFDESPQNFRCSPSPHLSLRDFESEAFLSALTQNMSPSISSSSTSASNGVFHRSSSSDAYAFPKKVSDAETRSFGRTRADSRRNSSCKQIVMETLQFSSINCNSLRPWVVMAAGLILKVLFLLFDNLHSLVQNLVLHYLMLELSLYIWMRLETQGASRQAPQSLLPSVLLLCGVPARAIAGFGCAYNVACILLRDFAMYLFSFLFLHFVYENYVR